MYRIILSFILVALISHCQAAPWKHRWHLEFLRAEERLYRNLSLNSPNFRPVENRKDTINVTMSLSIKQVLEMDDNKGRLTFESLVSMHWTAPNIVWDPSDYDDIYYIRMPVKNVWTPDISSYNGGFDGLKFGNVNVIIASSGVVFWNPFMVITAMCDIEMRHFPYDKHECIALFGSRSYHGKEISLKVNNVHMDVSTLSRNYVWDVFDAVMNVLSYYGPPEPHHFVHLKVKIQRRSRFLSYMYISPMVLIAILSPFIFLFPYQQPQRFSLGGSLLICLFLLLIGLDMVFPRNMNELPLISMYYMSVMVLLLVSMVLSAIILNLAEKDTKPPQILKRTIGDRLGCPLFLKKEEYRNLEEREEEIKEKKLEVTWRYIATVLDRFFFVVYIILTIILAFAFNIPR